MQATRGSEALEGEAPALDDLYKNARLLLRGMPISTPRKAPNTRAAKTGFLKTILKLFGVRIEAIGGKAARNGYKVETEEWPGAEGESLRKTVEALSRTIEKPAPAT